MEALVDTSAILAVLNEKDEAHEEAKETLQTAKEERDRLLTTNLVVAETYGLLLIRLDARHARRWLERNTLPVLRVSAEDEIRAEEILLSRLDKDYSYVDATSFALMERLSIDTAFTFDDHFAQFGFTSLTEAR